MKPNGRHWRVGLFSPNYPGVTGDGGIGTYTRTLAESLTQHGHMVSVVTTGNRPQRVVAGDVPLDVVARRPTRLVDRFAPASRTVWSVGQAALHAAASGNLDLFEFPNWEGLGIWFGMRRRIPLVVRLSTSSAETQAIDALPSTWALKCDVTRERVQASLADALVTHSDAHRRAMAAELGINPDRIAVVPLGVPVFPEFIRPPVIAPHPTVVFLGRLERRKGALTLLRSIPLVLAQRPDAKFILIGSDRPHCPAGRTHLQYIKDEFPPAIRRQIVITGPLNDRAVTTWLQSADLFVAPSVYESFGLTFLEAMRWGTPVIGTTAGAIPEIVEDGKSGVLVPPEDHMALASAIGALVADEQQRRCLGEAGRRRVETKFSVKAMTANNLDFYAGVIACSRQMRH